MRCLADFVLQKGLLTKETLHHLPQLFSDWKNPQAHDVPGVTIAEESVAEDASSDQVQNLRHQAQLRKPHIRVCALWDTVSSIGFPKPSLFGRGTPTELAFVNSNLPEGVDHVFQAVSLFERRFHFPPIVLKKPRQSTARCELQQCWFSGYHGDIGGGNEKEALAHFALAWMIARLRDFLTIDETAFWYWKDNEPTWVLPGEENFLSLAFQCLRSSGTGTNE